MFDTQVIQNNLRGLWAEAMVAELLAPEWRYTGSDWSGWDLEHPDGTRIEIKQSARDQSWGTSRQAPSFDIKAVAGHYPDGVTYQRNTTGERLAHLYIFAWHEGSDQRDVEQWQFFVVASKDLPVGQKTIGLNGIRKLANPIRACELASALSR